LESFTNGLAGGFECVSVRNDNSLSFTEVFPDYARHFAQNRLANFQRASFPSGGNCGVQRKRLARRHRRTQR
jgi:hypothetical protein